MREGACLGDRGSGQGKGRWGPGLFGLVRGSHYRSEAGVDLGEIGGISVVFGVEGNRRAREEFAVENGARESGGGVVETQRFGGEQGR